MKYSDKVKIIVFVPVQDAEALRQAMHQAGAGKTGDYSHCSWSSVGVGRFTPEKGAHPIIGEVGKPQTVDEERVEFLCPKDKLEQVIKALKETHPYEEVAYDVVERLDV